MPTSHACLSLKRPSTLGRAVRGILVLALALGAVGVGGTAARAATTAPAVATCGEHFCDKSGNEVTLRGYNVPVNGPEAETYANAAMGLNGNFLRLRVTWHQLEPKAPVNGVHQWDPTLLHVVDDIVQSAAAHNVQVLLTIS